MKCQTCNAKMQPAILQQPFQYRDFKLMANIDILVCQKCQWIHYPLGAMEEAAAEAVREYRQRKIIYETYKG